MEIAGPAATALASLTSEEIAFIRSIPKAELHAHLNGSIPIRVLQDMATEYINSSSPSSAANLNGTVQSGIQKLVDGVKLEKIDDFFTLFSAIYAITSTPKALARATQAVLSTFLDGDAPECNYLELRTTPRETPAMTREEYLKVVLSEVEKYPPEQASLIASLDRKMEVSVMEEIITIIGKLKQEGRRIVGVDLCGDPTAGDVISFEPFIARAKALGLGVTLHIAETTANSAEETLRLLTYKPDRLGHGTFLNQEATVIALEQKMCIEICLSSNLLCKTVSDLESHHIHQYVVRNHPIAICTDDILPFRTSLLGEYALLLAKPPYGLGLPQEEVKRIGEMSVAARFSR